MREALADAQLDTRADRLHQCSRQLDAAQRQHRDDVDQGGFRRTGATIPVSGTKGYYAHPFGATGAIEAALCALALDRQWIPPTINYQNPDPACDLDVVPNHGRAAELNYVMSNSFGFGGINACVVLGKVRRLRECIPNRADARDLACRQHYARLPLTEFAVARSLARGSG